MFTRKPSDAIRAYQDNRNTKKVEIPRSRCGWSCVAVESMDGWTDAGSENGEDVEYAVRDVKNQQVMPERSAVCRRGRKQNKAGVSFRARRKRHAGGH